MNNIQLTIDRFLNSAPKKQAFCQPYTAVHVIQSGLRRIGGQIPYAGQAREWHKCDQPSEESHLCQRNPVSGSTRISLPFLQTPNGNRTIRSRAFAFLVILFVALASPTAIFAQDEQQAETVVFDFNTSNGQPLERGQIISSVTVDDLTMSVNVESDGENDVGMIFDTSNPGPDPDLGTPNEDCVDDNGDSLNGPGVGNGGVPGTIGENCVALGNVLIIPRDVGPGAVPNDDPAGGVVSLVFSEPVQILEIHILDIDEETRAPLITFWDADGNPTLEDIRPQVVGNNGHEQFTEFPQLAAASVMTIQVTFPGSGALDSIIVAPADPKGGIDIIKYVNGADANDPAGDDVPRFAPGEAVAWTYHVTNTGQIAYPRAEVIVTDSDPTVDPIFDEELSGNGDEILDPGEVWAYLAVKEAVDLQSPGGNPSILTGICPQDDATLPPENGYMNIGTVTVPNAEATDPAHYCAKDPGIEIRKFVNGFDANDPLGDDVPRLAPGETVTWTYHVTNTGQVAYPLAQVVVTDSDAAVTPAFSQVLAGNDDDLLDPDEVWEYVAQSQAVNLFDSLASGGANPSVEQNLCPGDDGATPPDENGYKNIGTVTVPDAEDSDPAHYCGKEPGLLIRKFVVGNDANDPAGSDVPRFVPGQMVTWTYRLTNTGEISYDIDDLDVADSDPDVVPVFDKVLIGNEDQLLDPGEVWQYAASKEALDLRDVVDSSLVIVDGCPGIELDGEGTNAYQNIGSITAPGTGHEDPATYCNIIPDLDAGRTDVFELSYTVVNEGPVGVQNVRVFAGPNVVVTCPGDLLAPGESMACPAVASDIGFRNSIGWVVADPVGGGMQLIRAVAPDSVAGLSVVVQVNGLAADVPSGPMVDLAAAGGTADLAVIVTNMGSINLTALQAAAADQNLNCASGTLAPGESTTCALTINVHLGPQVLIGGISAQAGSEESGGERLMEELRVYMIGE